MKLSDIRRIGRRVNMTDSMRSKSLARAMMKSRTVQQLGEGRVVTWSIPDPRAVHRGSVTSGLTDVVDTIAESLPTVSIRSDQHEYAFAAANQLAKIPGGPTKMADAFQWAEQISPSLAFDSFRLFEDLHTIAVMDRAMVDARRNKDDAKAEKLLAELNQSFIEFRDGVDQLSHRYSEEFVRRSTD